MDKEIVLKCRDCQNTVLRPVYVASTGHLAVVGDKFKCANCGGVMMMDEPNKWMDSVDRNEANTTPPTPIGTCDGPEHPWDHCNQYCGECGYKESCPQVDVITTTTLGTIMYPWDDCCEKCEACKWIDDCFENEYGSKEVKIPWDSDEEDIKEIFKSSHCLHEAKPDMPVHRGGEAYLHLLETVKNGGLIKFPDGSRFVTIKAKV